jgi:predicted small lipoprotein YifL
MKKTLIIFLSLVLMLTFAACGEKNGGKSPSESSAPAESGNAPSGKAGADEVKYYGIGEAAEANGLSITIDGAEPFDYTGMLSRPKDGFEYVKVWFTFTNASNEPVESPDKKDLYIVYEEGPTGDDSDMTSEENSQVLPDVADRNQRYMEDEIDLAPGESVSGWMVYQRQTDKSEVTMHYYSGFVNVAPDLRFSFAVE